MSKLYNISKLKKMNPAEFCQKIVQYNMIATIVFHKTNGVIYPETYETLNPQNQVLAHGIFFKNLLAKYLAYLNINLHDPWLQTGTKYTNRPMISKVEFQNMPKRYRSIFTQYDSSHYILNEHKDTILTVPAANKEQLKSLLYKARTLIPNIYKTDVRDNVPTLSDQEHEQKWLNRTLGDTFMKPAFVPNSLSAHNVSNDQIKVIEQLRDIFIELDGISIMWTQERDNTHCAADIYAQYLNETSQTNRYLKMAFETRGLRTLYNNAPESERSGIAFLIKRAQEQSAAKRQQMIADMRDRIK